jgi:hypothetical protein
MTGCRSNRNRVLVVSPLRPLREKAGTVFVGNPLDMIEVLESSRDEISTVVLTGRYAANRELAAYLSQAYPALSIVSGRSGEEPDPYLPTYA